MSSEHHAEENTEPCGAIDAYRRAHALAREGDVLGWRQLLQSLQTSYVASLREWQAEHDSQPPREVEAFKEVADGLVESGAGLVAAGLGAVESGRRRFRDQRDTLVQVVLPPDWQRVGSAALVEGPYALGFVFHGLHGALCLRRADPGRAIRLAETYLLTDGRIPQRVCESPELMGWSATLGQNCTIALGYLLEGFGRWNWLSALFASDREYREAIVGYYLLLNTRELARRLARGDDIKSAVRPNVPLSFGHGYYEVADGAFLRLLRAEEKLHLVWEGVGITKDQMKEAWQPWMAVHGAAQRITLMPHEHLFDALS